MGVDHAGLNPIRFEDGTRELGFYNFYSQMIEMWIDVGHRYCVLLNRKQNCEAD